MYILRITIHSAKNQNNIKKLLLKTKKQHHFNFFKIKGIFKNKQKNKIFTVLKSPHVNKKSREHFIYKKYSQKIDIYFLNIFNLFNFLLAIKGFINKNNIIKTKIIKKLCL
jgi:ribosomal protein S10